MTILTENPVFEMSGNSWKKFDNLNQIVSGKSNMAAFKPEILISQLLDEIETIFRRLHVHFRGPAFEWD